MPDLNTQGTSGSGRRRLNVTLIKVIIVSIGSGVCAVLSAFSGITPQASVGPMLSWMLGFAADKATATSMRVTAVTVIAAITGAVWRCCLPNTIYAGHAPAGDYSIALLLPSGYGWALASLFIGATIGALVASRIKVAPGNTPVRRMLLFAGVCIGIYAAADAMHLNPAAPHTAPLVSGIGAFLLLGIGAGAVTQITRLASGIVLTPCLYYFAGYTAAQSTLMSLAVIGLATIVPLVSYASKGIGDKQYGGAGVVGAIILGFAGGAMLAVAPTKIVLLIFALMAMFFSARDISRIALDEQMTSGGKGPDLT